MIAVILVNWNGHADTIECIESLLRLDEEDYVVIVVDNGSVDGSLEALITWGTAPEPDPPLAAPWTRLPKKRCRQPRVKIINVGELYSNIEKGDIIVITTGENLGFAGANNVGMALASQSGMFDFIWLLNNDTVVAADSLTHLKRIAQEKPWAKIIGSTLIYYHDPNLVQGVAGCFNPLVARGGHVGHRNTLDRLPSLAQIEDSISYVMGASMFLSIATYRSIGPMSERYFLYFEELDWARRLGKKPNQSVAVNSIVYHKEGGSIGTSSLKRPSNTSLYYLNVNMLRFMWRWHRAFIFIGLLRVAREILSFFLRKDVDGVRVLGLAMRDFFTNVQRRGKII